MSRGVPSKRLSDQSAMTQSPSLSGLASPMVPPYGCVRPPSSACRPIAYQTPPSARPTPRRPATTDCRTLERLRRRLPGGGPYVGDMGAMGDIGEAGGSGDCADCGGPNPGPDTGVGTGTGLADASVSACAHCGCDPGSTWVRCGDCGMTIADSAACVSSAVTRWTGSLVSMAARSGSSAPARRGGRGSSRTTAVSAARSVSRSKGPQPSTA